MTSSTLPFREHVLGLGPDQHLVAIATEPRDPAGGGNRPAPVVLLNAGVLHRVGPHRLHVTLARALAATGRTALRVDLSGIGDSRPVPSNLPFRDSAVADTRVVLDHLVAPVGGRVILFGLCSGADNALATAAVDTRVGALVLIDPPAYATPRSQLRKLAANLSAQPGAAAAARWALALARRQARAQLDRARARLRPGTDATDADSGGRQSPPLPAYRRQLTALVDRGVAILCIYTGALGDRYNHAEQLFEWLPELRGRIDVAYFPDANHMFTERAAQAELVTTILRWLAAR